MQAYLRPLFACAMLALLATPALAQGKKYALLVGVKQYEHAKLGDLKHTENDVEELATLLSGSDAGFEVVVLTNTRGKNNADALPTSKNIRAQLKLLSAKVKKQDVLLVALAGHGLQIGVVDPLNAEKETSESFFCPSDARPKGKDTLDELKQTMIPLSELFGELENSGAGARLVLVDACRNELVTGSRSLDVDSAAKPGRGTAVLYSCKGGEKAFETDKLGKGHGVFFYHVIQGLKGQARNPRGEITWSRLAEYAIDHVSDEVPGLIGGGASQTPHEIRNIEGKSPVLLFKAEEKAEEEKATQPEKNKEEKVEEEKKAKKSRTDLDVDPDEEGKQNLDDEKKKDEKKEEDRKQDEKKDEQKQDDRKDEKKDEDRKQDEKKDEDRKQDEKKDEERKQDEKKDEGRKDEKVKPQDDATYQKALEVCYGMKGPADLKEGIRLLQRSAEKGYAPAKGMLGWMTYRGLGTKANREEGERLVKEALPGVLQSAQAGEPGSLFLLAGLYFGGVGVEKNTATAVEMAQKAADRKFAPAMRWLGTLANVRKNHPQEVSWYRKAVALGYAPAMISLAECYVGGRGVERNPSAARKLYGQAAELGHTVAMYRLGCMYRDGAGGCQDRKAAGVWLGKAASKGDERAMYALGQMWEQTCGKDSQREAMKWYAKSASCGYAPAQAKLRHCSKD